MDVLVTILILMIGIYHWIEGTRGVPSEIIGIGAIVGAALAAWFRRSTRWILQVVAGSWIGYASGGWLRDYLEWPLTSDYDLLSGTVMGALGFSCLQMALSPDFWKAVKARFGLVNDPQAPNQ